MKRFLISLLLIFLSLSGQAQISIIKFGFSKQYQEKIEAYATKFVNQLQEHTSITRATVTFSYGNTPRISISIPYNYQDIEKTTIFGCTNAIHWRDLRYVLSSLYEYRTYLASDGIVYNRDIMNIPIVIDLFRDTRNYISFVTYNTYRQRWPVVQLADYVRVVRDGLTYIVRLMSYGLSQGYLTTAEGEIDDVSGRRNPAYHFYRFFDMTPEELAQERKLEQERAIKAEIARRLAERRKDSIILVYKKRYDGKVFSLRGGAEWNKSSQIDSLEKYVCKKHCTQNGQ